MESTREQGTYSGHLYRMAFDISLQANIIFISDGSIVAANSAACKLLGYSINKLLSKNRQSIFDITESAFKKILKHKTAMVRVITNDGLRLLCEISYATFTDEDGIEKAIATITDVGKSILRQKSIYTKNEKLIADKTGLAKLKQKNLAIENEKIIAGNIIIAGSKQKKIDIKKEKIVPGRIFMAQAKANSILKKNKGGIKDIAKTSYDVMWDWNIATGEIFVGDSIREVFGYKVKNNILHFSDFSERVLPRQKDKVRKTLLKTIASRSNIWKDSFMVKRHDGSVASTTSRASIVRNEKGQALRLIGATQDVTVLHELENNLENEINLQEEYSKKFFLVAKLSFDVIWDWNLLANDVFIGDGFEELFGYAVKDNRGNIKADWTNYLHPDDKDAVEKGLQDAIASSSSNWEHSYKFIRADGSVAYVLNKGSILRHPDGTPYRLIGVMRDLSKQKSLEEKLEQEIKLKEKQIAEATEEGREIERSELGDRLDDNISQLLAAANLYFNMAKKGGLDSEMFLNRSSEFTLTAIKEITKLTKGLTKNAIKNFGLCGSIENLARDAMASNPVKIFCELESFSEYGINDKFKLIVFKIINEHLNNILHASAMQVTITLSRNKTYIILSISDNATGFEITTKQVETGLVTIKSYAESYNGAFNFDSKPGKGCVLTVTFHVGDALLINQDLI